MKIESPHAPDGATLHDPRGWTALDLDSTKCLRFIDPYGDTLFNQRQIAVLIDELQTALSELSVERGRRHRQFLAERAADANWQTSVVAEYLKSAYASDEELRSEPLQADASPEESPQRAISLNNGAIDGASAEGAFKNPTRPPMPH